MIRYLAMAMLFASHNDANPSLTIIRGSLAPIEKYPFMISVHDNLKYLCGGVILSHRFVTTAAHCVMRRDPRNVFIRVGSDIRTSGKIYNINLVVVHPAYNSSRVHDVAIMRLAKKLEYSTHVAPIKLAKSDMKLEPGQECTILGYGNTTPQLRGFQLMSAKVYVFSNDDCIEYSGVSMLPTRFCAGDLTNVTGPCVGDSGGPLIINDMLFGIISWGIGDCASAKHPGILVNVRYYAEFLNTVLYGC